MILETKTNKLCATPQRFSYTQPILGLQISVLLCAIAADWDECLLLNMQLPTPPHYPPAIGAVKIDQCSCGTERETIRRFLFHCIQWRHHRQEFREKAARSWGDLSYFLGGRSHAPASDRRTPLEKDAWRPNLEVV